MAVCWACAKSNKQPQKVSACCADRMCSAGWEPPNHSLLPTSSRDPFLHITPPSRSYTCQDLLEQCTITAQCCDSGTGIVRTVVCADEICTQTAVSHCLLSFISKRRVRLMHPGNERSQLVLKHVQQVGGLPWQLTAAPPAPMLCRTRLLLCRAQLVTQTAPTLACPSR